MRIFYLLFSLFIFCGLLNAQTVKIEYSGDPLPNKDRRDIEQFISHEVNFYMQFGLPDTLTLQLHVFEDRKEALKYLESINISLPFKANGVYFPQTAKGIHSGTRERTGTKPCHHLSRTQPSFRPGNSREIPA